MRNTSPALKIAIQRAPAKIVVNTTDEVVAESEILALAPQNALTVGLKSSAIIRISKIGENARRNVANQRAPRGKALAPMTTTSEKEKTQKKEGKAPPPKRRILHMGG